MYTNYTTGILYNLCAIYYETILKKEMNACKLPVASLEMFCSSHLLGCYCRPNYLCKLVRFIRQVNLS